MTEDKFMVLYIYFANELQNVERRLRQLNAFSSQLNSKLKRNRKENDEQRQLEITLQLIEKSITAIGEIGDVFKEKVSIQNFIMRLKKLFRSNGVNPLDKKYQSIPKFVFDKLLLDFLAYFELIEHYEECDFLYKHMKKKVANNYFAV